MKTFQLDLHHVVLYCVIGLVSLGAIGVLHSWELDRMSAKVKYQASQETLAAIDKDRAVRAKQYEAQLELLTSKRVTAKTPAPILEKRIAELEPDLAALPLANTNPEALPPGSLVFTPADQVVLINRLVDCKVCETNLKKLQEDFAGEQTKTTIQKQTIDDLRKGPPLKKKIRSRLINFGVDVLIVEGLRILAGKP